jgi:sterol desaturase/sphingolipid hydroxylase (fatty acid hydroxylase superfamily)
MLRSSHSPTAGAVRTRRVAVVVLRYVAYPVLLLIAVATVIVSIRLDATLPLINFGFVVFAFGYLALLEQVIPYDRGWLPEAWEWRRDGLYYVVTMMSGGLARGAIAAAGTLVAPLRTSLPLWAEIPLAMVVMSFCSFMFHRLSHHVPWLWKLHGVHHAPPKVNVANNSVNQFLDVTLNSLASQLPLFLLGLSQPAVFAATVFKAAQGYGVHANIDVKLGWLNYLFVTPEQHRLHNSTVPHESGHYAADLPFWDLLFGSFTWAPDRTPRTVGLQDPTAFPSVRSVLANQVHPFRRSGYLQRRARR